MKILLIRPPNEFDPLSDSPAVGIPAGLLYLAAVVRDAGFTTEVKDLLVDVNTPQRPLENGMVHMGRSWEDIRREIAVSAPDIAGISCTFASQAPAARRVASTVRELFPSCLIIVGGPYPTTAPEAFLSGGAADLVCMGEGELTLLETARKFAAEGSASGIYGTAEIRDGKTVLNPPRPLIDDLDTLPLPAYDLIDLNDYYRMSALGYSGRPSYSYPGSERSVSVITSRGCPFDCVFCSIHLHMGRKWRAHSADYVLRHIKTLHDVHNAKHFHFEDDNISFNIERFDRILTAIIDSGMKITFDTPNGIRADRLTSGLLTKFRDAGGAYIILAPESGDQDTLDRLIGKKMDLRKVTGTAAECAEIGLDAMAFFVVGFPGETPEKMRKTVDFALKLWKKYHVLPSVFIATPLKGTRLHQICVENGFIDGSIPAEEISRTTVSGGKRTPITTPEFGAAEIRSVMQSFHSGFKKIFLLNLFMFFALRPFRLARAVKFTKDRAAVSGMKKAMLEAFMYKNCIGRLK